MIPLSALSMYVLYSYLHTYCMSHQTVVHTLLNLVPLFFIGHESFVIDRQTPYDYVFFELLVTIPYRCVRTCHCIECVRACFKSLTKHKDRRKQQRHLFIFY